MNVGISGLRRELRNYVDAALARMFVWTLTANTSALGNEDHVAQGDNDDNPTPGQRPVRRVEPFGMRSRPPAKQRSLSLRLGSSTVLYLGIASDGGYGPKDLADGEVVLYSKNVPQGVRLMDNGDVALASKAGQVVSVNGTTYAMPKWDDYSTDLDTLIGAVAGMPVAVNLFDAITNMNTIRAAFTAFQTAKLAALDYKSTKAKNG
ncbi:MAG: hypothetical protein ABI445_00775 [Polyangia bacterium]